jgi:hypothetical protein
MELRDLIVTPIVIILVYVVAYLVRPYCTDHITRKYFMPGLTVRIIGALAVGFIYQFYYNGGDTFNFHTHGSRHVWEAFMDDPVKGLRLFLNNAEDQSGIFKYSSKIWFYRDPSSFQVIRIAALIDLMTFSAYSATAVIFGCISFAGMWLFFLTFYKQFPRIHRNLAIAALFVPSVFFWGSGILKDTLTLAALGAASFSIYQLGVKRNYSVATLILMLFSLYLLYTIKVYILLTFLPAAIVWLFVHNYRQIRSLVLRVMMFPLIMILAILCGYYAIMKTAEENPKYSLDGIARTAQITAYDIRFWTGREAGSGYTLGELDGSWQSMISLAPAAINVSLFRPYLWEVSNPLMFLSAMESVCLLIATVVLLIRRPKKLPIALSEPNVLFCLLFSVTFAFAVGVSTYNFGTLSRYKIPLLPFYMVALLLVYYHSNSDKNSGAIASTE